MKKLSSLLNISLLLLISVACNSQEKPATSTQEEASVAKAAKSIQEEKKWKDLSTTEFEASFIANAQAVVVDIRTPEEWDKGHLKEASLVNWYTVFKEESKGWDKDSHYYLYCRSGGRSRAASIFLTENGFKNVYNMLGGMNAWKGEVVVD